ncbi:MAG: MFS transporter [Bdellovibrio sp.]|nr:MFS transporter [Bdellovibrio sp.]
MYLSLFFMGIGSLIFSLASLAGTTFWPMVLGAIIFGIGNGFCSICINILLGQVAPAPHRRQLFSGLHAMYGLASLCAPLIATLFGPKLWPYAFLLSMMPALIFLIIALISFRNDVHPLVTQVRSKSTLPFLTGLIYPGSMLAFYVCAEVLLATRLSQYLEHALQWDYHQATAYNFYFFMSLTIGRVLIAVLPIRVNNSAMLLISLIASTACFALGFKYPMTFLMTGFFMSYFFPLTMDAVTDQFKETAPSYIAKSIVLGGLWLSGMHYLVGMATDYWGIRVALLPGPVFLILALAILLKYKFIGCSKSSG